MGTFSPPRLLLFSLSVMRHQYWPCLCSANAFPLSHPGTCLEPPGMRPHTYVLCMVPITLHWLVHTTRVCKDSIPEWRGWTLGALSA